MNTKMENANMRTEARGQGWLSGRSWQDRAMPLINHQGPNCQKCCREEEVPTAGMSLGI
jgi:hypothetical protein